MRTHVVCSYNGFNERLFSHRVSASLGQKNDSVRSKLIFLTTHLADCVLSRLKQVGVIGFTSLPRLAVSVSSHRPTAAVGKMTAESSASSASDTLVLIGATGNDDEALCQCVSAAVGSPAGPWCADSKTLADALRAASEASPAAGSLGMCSAAVCCSASAVADLGASESAMLACMPHVIVLRGPGSGEASAWAPLRRASTFEVVVPALSTAVAAKSATNEVARLLSLSATAEEPSSVNRRRSAELNMGPDTFFLSTTCKQVKELIPLMKEIEAEVDVIELRAVR